MRENHPFLMSMVRNKQSNKPRWITAIISGFGIFLLSFCAIRPEKNVSHWQRTNPKPFIQLVDKDFYKNDRDYEAFFLPKKYNFTPKVKIPKSHTKKEQTKPIFSQLDRLRILRTFTNRFTESEYWTVSRIHMHPYNRAVYPSKYFIKNPAELLQNQEEILPPPAPQGTNEHQK